MNYHKVYMNHIHSSSLLTELAHMWKSQSMCDAVIKTGTISCKAHRLVLVASCPMLKSMDCASVGSHVEVQLSSDIKQESVHTFLQYLYEGFMMLTEDNYKEVEKIGRILQVDSVIKCCADFYESLHSNSEYRYNYHDHVEFKHVRHTDMLKVQERRHSKRKPDTVRRFNAYEKKPKSDDFFSHGANVINVSSLGQKSDDQIFMSNSYDAEKTRAASYNTVSQTPLISVENRSNVSDSSSAKLAHDGVQISIKDSNNLGASFNSENSSSSLQISVASEVQENASSQIINTYSDLTQDLNSDASQSLESDSIQILPNKPTLIGPFTQGVARQPENYYETSTPMKGTYQVGTLDKGRKSTFSRSFSGGLSLADRRKPKIGIPKSRMRFKETRALLSSVTLKKKDEESVGAVEIPDEGSEEAVMSKGHHHGSDDGSIRDDMEIEEPPPDDVKVTADLSGIWYEEKCNDDTVPERKTWQSKDGSGLALKRSLEMNSLSGHHLIRIEGCKKACAYCDINRLKTKSGWQIKSYFKCEACDVPLCKSSKECFAKYHELRLEQPNISPKELQKQMKAQTKPLQIHNIVGGASDLQSYIDMTPPLASISPPSSVPSPQPASLPVTCSTSPQDKDLPPLVSSNHDAQPSCNRKSSNPPKLQASPLVSMVKPNPAVKAGPDKDESTGFDNANDNSDIPPLIPASTDCVSRPSDIIIQ